MTPSEKNVLLRCRWKTQLDDTNIDSGSFGSTGVYGQNSSTVYFSIIWLSETAKQNEIGTFLLYVLSWQTAVYIK